MSCLDSCPNWPRRDNSGALPELDIQRILQELAEGGVEFLLIGGAEVDGSDEFEPGELPDPLDPASLELGGNWVLSTRLGRLYVMQWIGDSALWSQLAPRAEEVRIGDLSIKVVAFDDLVRLKELAGRPQDLIDLQRLREAREGS